MLYYSRLVKVGVKPKGLSPPLLVSRAMQLRREVDFVVRFSNEELLGIEVKSGSSVGLGDFKHLKWFAENLAKARFCGIVLYSGNKVLPFGENLFAVPFAALAI